MKRISAIPFYAVAVVWGLWAWLLPLYEVWHYFLLIVLSIMVYGISAAICQTGKEVVAQETPAEKTEREAKEKAEAERKAQEEAEAERKRNSTGNPDLDRLIQDRERAVSEMHRLNGNIPDEELSAQIEDLEDTTKKIIDHVLEHPEKLPQIRKFMNYYLPTTLKLLNIYDRMGAQGVEGENIDGTMERVEDTFGRIVAAYHKQLDSLFANEAMDVTTDIKVMENLLKQEGFIDS